MDVFLEVMMTVFMTERKSSEPGSLFKVRPHYLNVLNVNT